MNNIYELLKKGIRFKISSNIVVVIIDDNTVNLRASATQDIVTLRDSSGEGKLGKIIEYLAENYTTIDELKNKFGLSEEDVRDLINMLSEAGVLVFSFKELGGEENPFNDYLNLKISSSHLFTNLDAVKNVYSSRILIVGINQISLTLVKDLYALTKNIELVDFKDSIEDMTFEGLPIPEYLNKIGIKYGLYAPYKLELENKPDIVVVVREYDDVHLFEEINKYMVKNKIKWVLAYIDGTKFYISSFIPNATACYHCGLTLQNAHFALHESYKRYMSLISRRNIISVKRTMGLTPFHLKLYSGIIGLEIIELLLTNEGYFTGKELAIDSINLEFEVTRLLKNPRCSVCSRVFSTPAPFRDILFEKMVE